MRIGIVGNVHKPKAKSVIHQFVNILSAKEIQYVFSKDLVDFLDLSPKDSAHCTNELEQMCDFIVAFGGDGTILSTANQVGASGIPILGVNIGTLGFLAEVIVEELEAAVDSLISNKYQIIHRMALEVQLNRCNETTKHFALNDLVLEKGASSRLIAIQANVDGDLLNTYRSDGIIIATPTGSTAYSMSAGGPLVEPDMDAFVITPICPHSLSVRPIILSHHHEIELSIRSKDDVAQVHIDGRSKSELEFGHTVRIKQADYTVNLISIGERDFFEILRTKLNWGVEHPGVISKNS